MQQCNAALSSGNAQLQRLEENMNAGSAETWDEVLPAIRESSPEPWVNLLADLHTNATR